MKHMKLAATTLALVCVLSLAGCGNSNAGQSGDNEPPTYSQIENQSDSENTNTSNETATNLDDLLKTVLLRGSVADFQNGCFNVVPDQDDGQMIIAAAEGM